MQQSNRLPRKIKIRVLSERDKRRIETTKKRKGADFYKKNGSQAGKQSTTKFNSQTASASAKLRWKKERERKEKDAKNKSNMV